jgi:hypothetical protein
MEEAVSFAQNQSKLHKKTKRGVWLSRCSKEKERKREREKERKREREKERKREREKERKREREKETKFMPIMEN